MLPYFLHNKMIWCIIGRHICRQREQKEREGKGKARLWTEVQPS